MQNSTAEAVIDMWFAEDLGDGDHTTMSTIPGDAEGTAVLLAKENGVLAGVEYAKRIFNRLDKGLAINTLCEDGAQINPGDRILSVEGSVRSILQSERLVLNVMQRMSGIATTTALYAERIRGTGATILDTRKTTPGFRVPEKEAVRIGGGMNHRFGLYDMILIKDNHIDFAGGISDAIERAHQYLEHHGRTLKIEIEARSLDDIREILAGAHVDRILLDNFSPELTRKAVQLIDGRIETESSGGITLQTIRSYAEAGVDYISVGALTHHIRSLDMSLIADFN